MLAQPIDPAAQRRAVQPEPRRRPPFVAPAPAFAARIENRAARAERLLATAHLESEARLARAWSLLLCFRRISLLHRSAARLAASFRMERCFMNPALEPDRAEDQHLDPRTLAPQFLHSAGIIQGPNQFGTAFRCRAQRGPLHGNNVSLAR